MPISAPNWKMGKSWLMEWLQVEPVLESAKIDELALTTLTNCTLICSL